jgi:excisionase family DNA binding protein
MLKVREAAAYIGATVNFIRTKIWDGSLPYVTFGKRYLIDKADLDKLIDAEKVPVEAWPQKPAKPIKSDANLTALQRKQQRMRERHGVQ